MDGPSLLHIYTNSKSQTTPSSAESPSTTTSDTSEPTHTINMWNEMPEAILEAFIAKTGAEVVPPTELELEQLREVEEQKKRSEKDRAQVLEHLTKERRERELLNLARGEAPAAS